MKTVYLRIGSDKAGTVSIANLAEKNQSVFLRHSFNAPSRNCLSLCEILLERHQIKGIDGFKDRSQKRRRGIVELMERLDRSERIDENVFLTTETLWGRLSKRNLEPVRSEVARFLRSIRETFPEHEVKVVLHLRRIDLYLESLYKQDIKAGRPVTLEGLRERVTAERVFAFFRMLEEAFGPENLIVRPFERSQLHNGCVVEDMLHTMGLSDHVNEFRIVHGNEGLHRDLMEVLISMNERYGKVTPNNRLLQISSRLGKEYGFEDVKYLLDRATREELLAQYADFYGYLAQHYGNGEPFFRDPLPDDSHLAYSLNPERAALIEELVLEQADEPVEEVVGR
ncbi:hypothetical protein [Thioalkalivibrio sp. ALR17-21]|uniref:hypothetical protein n=1 Tax=Thioalkalivibrio sp. ALR17-21 TaxID=1269813 RepID=UPI0012DC2802|nr:hypothetical protein [Thioalkalivibrio sp. ALR17-21]